jgi:hypothetical protein
MTGFNERVVNPGMKPFKGYWIVVNDSGMSNTSVKDMILEIFKNEASANPSRELKPHGCPRAIATR